MSGEFGRDDSSTVHDLTVSGQQLDDEDKVDADPEYDRIKNLFPSFVAQEFRNRLRLRKQQFHGVPAFKVFSNVVGEWSRADNPYCCINGCADHKFVSEYMRNLPEIDNNKKSALLFLADCGDAIQASREQILSLMMVDQSMNANNHGKNIDEIKQYFDSSLGDIPVKSWSEQSLADVKSGLTTIKDALTAWQQARSQLALVGEQCVAYLGNISEEDKRKLISSGSIQEGEIRMVVFDQLEDLLIKALEVFDNTETSLEQKSIAFNSILDALTNAQALLEGQYYSVGIAVIRASQSQAPIDLPRSAELSDNAVFPYQIEESTSEYRGARGNHYHVLSPLELYRLSTRIKGEPENPEIVSRLNSSPVPLIEEGSAMVWCEEEKKVYRPRHKGSVYLNTTSALVMEQINTPHPNLIIDQVDGQLVLLEEYLLDAQEATLDSVELMSAENCNTVIAHMLLTEDLDCHSRNFIKTGDGKVLRVDSKQVFQDSDHNNTAFEVETDELRFEKILERVRFDPFIRAVVNRCSEEGVLAITNSFDTSSIQSSLSELGVPHDTINYIVKRIVEHKDLVSERLQKLKETSQVL